MGDFLKYIEDNFPVLFGGTGTQVLLWGLGTIVTITSTILGIVFHKKKKNKALRVSRIQKQPEINKGNTPSSTVVESTAPTQLPEPNLHFFNRDEYNNQIVEAFKSPVPGSYKQILSGMGGVGKTQIALGFAHKSMSNGKYKDGVFWVSAESKDTVKRGFLSIAEELGIADRAAKSLDMLQIFHDLKSWFTAKKDWLLIIDNVKKEDVYKSFLPNNTNGHILIVTQVKRLGKQLHIPVDVFSLHDAKSFIRIRLGTSFGSNEALEPLVKRLGMFPLAMEQAITYMLNTGMSFKEYLSLLEKYGLRAFNERDAQLNDYRHIVTTTWQISFAMMKKRATRQLFYLCSYMAPEDIPVDLFKRQKDLLPYPLKKLIEDELSVGKILSDLQSYSLVNNQAGYLYIHGLVQESMRMRLEQKWKLPIRWLWQVRTLKIIAKDKRDYDAKVETQEISLKDRFNWCTQMATHISAVKFLAERKAITSVKANNILENVDFTTYIVL